MEPRTCPVYDVALSDGRILQVTDSHPIMLANGEWGAFDVEKCVREHEWMEGVNSHEIKVGDNLFSMTDAIMFDREDEVGLEIIYNGVGAINESDVNLAASSASTLIGFNVRADSKAKKLIEINNQELFYFSVIYELIDHVKNQLSGLLEPDIKEEIIGIAEVKDVFRSSKLGAIAGSIVSEGVIQKDQPIRVLRDNVVIYEGELESLRRFKEDVKEVKSGTECGLSLIHI